MSPHLVACVRACVVQTSYVEGDKAGSKLRELIVENKSSNLPLIAEIVAVVVLVVVVDAVVDVVASVVVVVVVDAVVDVIVIVIVIVVFVAGFSDWSVGERLFGYLV